MTWWGWVLIAVAAVLVLFWFAFGRDISRYLRIRRM